MIEEPPILTVRRRPASAPAELLRPYAGAVTGWLAWGCAPHRTGDRVPPHGRAEIEA